LSRSFRIEQLGPRHRRETFDSGSPPLDRYLREQASQDIRRKVSNCFVAASEDGAVVAYYTFAASSVLLGELPPDIAKRLPRYPLVPCALVGRLAVDLSAQRDGIGGAMLFDAAVRADRADPAIHSLLVEAKDETAGRFYERFGFRSFIGSTKRLFLPVATAMAAIKN
jgi:GNAT superfamily N-acetyltransferase